MFSNIFFKYWLLILAIAIKESNNDQTKNYGLKYILKHRRNIRNSPEVNRIDYPETRQCFLKMDPKFVINQLLSKALFETPLLNGKSHVLLRKCMVSRNIRALRVFGKLVSNWNWGRYFNITCKNIITVKPPCSCFNRIFVNLRCDLSK